MDDNPEGTPNPLNPNSSEHTELVSEPDTMPSSASSGKTVVDMFVSQNKTTTPPTVEESVQETTITETVDSLDPMYRPMQKADVPEVKPVKKKNTGLIIAAIICILAAIGCAIAAAMCLLAPKTNVVANAIEKLLSSQIPKNVEINGKINIAFNNTESLFSDASIDTKTSLIANSMINSTHLDISITPQRDNDPIKFSASEVYAPSGDLYLRAEGITEAMNDLLIRQEILNPGSTEIKEEEIEEDEEVDPVMQLSMLSDTVESISDVWMRFSNDDTTSISTNPEMANPAICMANLANEFANNSNSITKLYQEHSFIASIEDGTKQSLSLSPVYRIALNETQLTDFIESLKNSKAFVNFNNCMGNTRLPRTEDIIEEIKKLPEIYVEVDQNNNFSRVFFDVVFDEAVASFDFSISYPLNINIREPEEYEDFSNIFPELFQTEETE